MPVEPVRILFVCLGNICRSPLAEIVVRSVAEQRGLDHYCFASAGTGDWHVGGPADPRSSATAQAHGLDLSRHRAQQVTSARVGEWDWFIAMDRQNRNDLLAMGVAADRLLLMRQFEDAETELDVPDPYYGGADGFEDAYHMLVANAEKLLSYLQAMHPPQRRSE
ncbi:MAG: protein tyrosine phosphatase [Zetaproteobacteria bacterium CG12_big_fil_rev_8_21_14_0_65_54_13]|nr:MAG: protein tyrosine phosphatase [Zetaproteobacteria bacterium CG12_big_fil_rev_8_21_14_0_65_54_13]PIX53637.1 MAG: protein tyrosine phosphatase [Zetaproteobacteria bacterium CG_4_10_14_3_um_filter_54_28]PJA27905.1 MAG: protein tyrosine phosphatase [Zetaproteobacteria bacterium CG_4_9_14_3_um_filter_54_145]